MNLFDDYSALDNVLVALPGGAGARLRLRGATPRARPRSSTRPRRCSRASACAGKEHVRAKSLSYGERRALEIGVALAAQPRLLFLDEPTAGLGAEGTARLAELIARAEARRSPS